MKRPRRKGTTEHHGAKDALNPTHSPPERRYYSSRVHPALVAVKNSRLARFSKRGRRIVATSSAAIGKGQTLRFKSFKLAILATTAVVSVALTGCDTTQEMALSANTENIMKIHAGMSSDKILEMFGAPKSVSQSVCGAAVGKPWTCTTWEYGEAWYERSSFTFSGDHGSLILNNFEVHRK